MKLGEKGELAEGEIAWKFDEARVGEVVLENGVKDGALGGADVANELVEASRGGSYHHILLAAAWEDLEDEVGDGDGVLNLVHLLEILVLLLEKVLGGLDRGLEDLALVGADENLPGGGVPSLGLVPGDGLDHDTL